MIFFVYELLDPRTNKVKYVGVTDQPNDRLRQHIQGYKSTHTKLDWLKELENAGVQPIMRIIEQTTTRKEAEEREKHWIQVYLKRGYHLVNVQHAKSFLRLKDIKPSRRAKKIEHVAQSAALMHRHRRRKVDPDFVHSFEENGETWLCTTLAFKGWRGTCVFDFLEEYGLVATQVRGQTTYYRQNDLPAFVKWTRTRYQYPPDQFRDRKQEHQQ